MTNKEKAITIAMGTFLSSWEGTAIEAWERISQEEDLEAIDYVLVWQPFECEPFGVVLDAMESLINQIVKNFE